jgi:hypothetical protein
LPSNENDGKVLRPRTLICLGKHLAGITTLETEDLRKGTIPLLNMALDGNKNESTIRNDLEGTTKEREGSLGDRVSLWTHISGRV